MLFDHDVRAPAEWEVEYAGDNDEPARIRAWQREQLTRIGYDRATARRIVRTPGLAVRAATSSTACST